MIRPLIHFTLILHQLLTYNRCSVYFICGGQLYDCVLHPYCHFSGLSSMELSSTASVDSIDVKDDMDISGHESINEETQWQPWEPWEESSMA